MKTIVYETSTGRVTRMGYRDAEVPADLLPGLKAEEVSAFPEEPMKREGFAATLYRAADGTLAWREEAVEPPPDVPDPTPEEAREAVREARQAAYRERVDPLTAEISRLRDMAPDDPRIAEAEAEREAAVAAIVAANPYPEEGGLTVFNGRKPPSATRPKRTATKAANDTKGGNHADDTA